MCGKCLHGIATIENCMYAKHPRRGKACTCTAHQHNYQPSCDRAGWVNMQCGAALWKQECYT